MKLIDIIVYPLALVTVVLLVITFVLDYGSGLRLNTREPVMNALEWMCNHD